jgi:hypothetical protein
MSLRFGSGWLVIYFVICSCTLICSAPQLRAIIRRLILLNRSHALSHRILGFWVTFSPLARRAALTVEVTRPRGRPASRCCVGAFQNSQRLEMCGAPRSGQRGWSTCTQAEFTFRMSANKKSLGSFLFASRVLVGADLPVRDQRNPISRTLSKTR